MSNIGLREGFRRHLPCRRQRPHGGERRRRGSRKDLPPQGALRAFEAHQGPALQRQFHHFRRPHGRGGRNRPRRGKSNQCQRHCGRERASKVNRYLNRCLQQGDWRKPAALIVITNHVCEKKNNKSSNCFSVCPIISVFLCHQNHSMNN